MNSKLHICFCLSVAICTQFGQSSLAQDPKIPLPKTLLDFWKIELVDSEPNIVTPTACDVDAKDNLYVVECHTHFPPKDYDGPKTDRVWVYIDADRDGKFERRELFYEGGIASMSLACDKKDGWVYISSRSQIIRCKDTDGDFKTDTTEQIIKHETEANYPHNGLSSLLLTGDNELMFGQGENFGEHYEIIGTDGSKQTGGGEGGNIFVCKRDGSEVRRYATGFWNPFGLAYQNGRYYVVDNDPDATPPNRLLQVSEGADYGFQFRFGRAGTNPLLSWNGEYPGTFGMVAGVGEAACAIEPVGKGLIVSSWGDNRIEAYEFESRKEDPSHEFPPLELLHSVKSGILVQGNSMFRPVDFATNSKGEIYITDWVDRSYEVHSKGRIWKLIPSLRHVEQFSKLPKVSNDEQLRDIALKQHIWDRCFPLARKPLSEKLSSAHVEPVDLLLDDGTWMVDEDFIEMDLRQDDLRRLNVDYASISKQTLHWLWIENGQPQASDEFSFLLREISQELKSQYLSERLKAIRFAAELKDKRLLTALEDRLGAKDLNVQSELRPLIAAISYIKSGGASGGRVDPAREEVLKELLLSKRAHIDIRVFAMRELSPMYDDIKIDQVEKVIQEEDYPALTHHFVAWLAAKKDDTSKSKLEKLISDVDYDKPIRADAFAALYGLDPQRAMKAYESLENKGSLGELDVEAKRAEEQARLQMLDPDSPESVVRQSRLPLNDTEAYLAKLNGKGNADAGWRVWVRSQCVKCHAWEGRGATVGPELSSIARGSTREQLLTSILQPSKEVAPLYVTWKVLTTEGKVVVGSKVNGGGVGESNRYLLADGTTVDIAQEDIEEQEAVEESIMPNNIAHTLSIEELADLMAMFSQRDYP